MFKARLLGIGLVCLFLVMLAFVSNPLSSGANRMFAARYQLRNRTENFFQRSVGDSSAAAAPGSPLRPGPLGACATAKTNSLPAKDRPDWGLSVTQHLRN
jgi:Na+-transporting methylmalonyl-CoA/oxaloacetate decarboxylase gamma subunit